MMVGHGRIEMGHDLASPPICWSVCWLPLRICRTCNCLLIVDTVLRCNALPLGPMRVNGPVLVGVVNANAL